MSFCNAGGFRTSSRVKCSSPGCHIVGLDGNVVSARLHTVSDGIDRLFATTGFADDGEVPFHAGALPIRERPSLPGLGVEAHGYDIAV